MVSAPAYRKLGPGFDFHLAPLGTIEDNKRRGSPYNCALPCRPSLPVPNSTPLSPFPPFYLFVPDPHYSSFPSCPFLSSLSLPVPTFLSTSCPSVPLSHNPSIFSSPALHVPCFLFLPFFSSLPVACFLSLISYHSLPVPHPAVHTIHHPAFPLLPSLPVPQFLYHPSFLSLPGPRFLSLFSYSSLPLLPSQRLLLELPGVL